MKLKAVEKAEAALNSLETNIAIGAASRKYKLQAHRLKVLSNAFRRLSESVLEIHGVVRGPNEEFAEEWYKMLKKSQKELRSLLKDENATNGDLVDLFYKLSKEGFDYLKVIKRDPEQVSDIVYETCEVSEETLQALNGVIVAKREFSLFDAQAREGEALSAISEGKEVVTFGTSKDLGEARNAKNNGVNHVFKGGLRSIQKECLDVAVSFFKGYQFISEAMESSIREDAQERHFRDLFGRKYVRKNGWYICTLPYYLLPRLNKFFKNVSIKQIVRCSSPREEEQGMVLIVAKNQAPIDEIQTKIIKKAYLQPQKLPEVKDLETIRIEGEEVLYPEYKPRIIEPSDIRGEFGSPRSSFSAMEDMATTPEKATELSQPLQEYKVGHLPAVATSEVINGLYDPSVNNRGVGEEVKYAHLFSAKVIQQEVEKREQTEERDGSLSEEVSLEKKNTVVLKSFTQDGTITTLLNTAE